MKGYIIIASLFAALAILFGAFGSHALKERLSAQSLEVYDICLLYTSPSPRDKRQSRMPSSA